MNKFSSYKPLKQGSWKLATDIAVADGLTLEDLRSDDRRKKISKARAKVIRALNDHGTHVAGIARILNKNHCSIRYYICPTPSQIKRNKNEQNNQERSCQSS